MEQTEGQYTCIKIHGTSARARRYMCTYMSETNARSVTRIKSHFPFPVDVFKDTVVFQEC